ncbi:sugar-binding protein [Paenibacillus chartarius]|uniref:Sugar-binding protein n=1 Tax=Paenibacillus chartarius TaxID=747481 RepID=A0ABV6DEI0_9BACL
MNDRRGTMALSALGLLFLFLLGQFGYSYLKISEIVSELADAGQQSKAYRHHVVLISQELDNPFWRTIGKAAEEAAKDYNMELEYVGPFRLNPMEQTKLLDKMIASRVDGILVQGVDTDEYKRLINKAIERHIPVITVDTDSPDSSRLTYVGTDNRASGHKLGEVVIESLRKEPGAAMRNRIGVIIGSAEAANQQQRLEGFKAAVGAEPYMPIAGVAVSNISRIQAAQAAESLLREHPDINVMVGLSALDAVGILQAVKVLGMQDRVRIFGFDDLEETKAAIAKGEIVATVIQKPEEMGREAVRQLHAYFGSGELAPYHFTSHEVLDRSNVGVMEP